MISKDDFLKKCMSEHHYVGPVTGFEACKNCGLCCYKNACSCAPADLGGPITVENVERMLKTGNFMITATYIVDETVETSLPVPIRVVPHISAREVGAGEVHISLLHNKCKMLGPNGCTLSEKKRPSQGLLLIPDSSGNCQSLMPFMDELWRPYSDVLDEVVKKKTGMTAQQHLEKELFPLRQRLINKLRMNYLLGIPMIYSEYMALRVFEYWNALSQDLVYALNCVEVIVPGYPGEVL